MCIRYRMDQGVYTTAAATIANFNSCTRLVARACALLHWLAVDPTIYDVNTMRELKIPKAAIELLSPSVNRFFCQTVVNLIMHAVHDLCNLAHDGVHEDLLDAGVVTKLSGMLRDPARAECHKLAEEALCMLSRPLKKRGEAPARGVLHKRALGEW